MRRTPPEFVTSLVAGRNKNRGVAGPSEGSLRGNRMASHFSTHLDDFTDRIPVAGSQIVNPVLTGLVGLKRQEVRVGKIFDVNIVPDARAILRRPVVAKNLHSIAVA